METIIILNVIVITIAYFARYKNLKYLLEICFIIIFAFTSIRYKFGTDYSSYQNIYESVSNYSALSEISYNLYDIEAGWLILNFLLKPFGFFGFIIVLSSFLCYTYYSLIKKYVKPQYYWLAILTYVFSFDIMLIHFSALRQALSIAIFILSIKYLDDKRNPLLFILMILLAASFHSSAYFIIPIVIFSLEKVRNSKLTGILILLTFFILLFWGEFFISDLLHLVSYINDDKYISRFDYESSSSTTIVGSIFWGTFLIIIMYYSRFQSKLKLIFYLGSLYYFIYIMTSLIWLSDRMGFYFAPFSIVIYPAILSYEKNKLIKFALLTLFMIAIFYKFSQSLSLEWVVTGYKEYHTIFSH